MISAAVMTKFSNNDWGNNSELLTDFLIVPFLQRFYYRNPFGEFSIELLYNKYKIFSPASAIIIPSEFLIKDFEKYDKNFPFDITL